VLTVIALLCRYMTQSAELMRRGKMPSKSDLQKGVDVTEISVPSEVKI